MTTNWKLLSALAGLSLMATAADAGEGFIRPQTRIDGCIAIVNKVRSGEITPTEWLEQNKEEFADLHLELKSRNYPPQKAKEIMMGMAITLCMERKVPDHLNTCVTASDEEKRDLQIMRTAHIAECWARRRVAVVPQKPEGDLQIEIRPTEPPPVAQGPVLPPMSPADLAQFQEDWAIISQPVRFRGDDEGGKKEARFSQCADYWQSLHYNRPQNVRQILYSVRVARCMFRTDYAVLPVRCQGGGFGAMLQPRCYARF